ncbi:MAG TPA: DNA topoisomerase, partial [Symbiobacteriaceae bacterium]|nr:DNA topoisomerase [Symbiobacteriaceae bacterium]
QKQTQPPRRLTEASLLGAMETAGKEMDDEALREAMKGRGLGTPATRASIIERLKDVGYIIADKKALVPTDKGHRLVQLAEAAGTPVLLSAELTGEWEKHIADIQAGEYQPERFMAEIQGLALHVVQQVRQTKGEVAQPAPGTNDTPGAAVVSEAGATPEAPAPKRGGRKAKAAAGQDSRTLPAYAGKCPRCGRSVVKTSREWSCDNHDCTLRIPAWLCGKVVDTTLAEALLTKGRTKLITGFKSQRTGKTFSAFLVLKEGQVGFEFPPDKPAKKASGYRRNGGGTGGEPTAATKAGSRKTGSRTNNGTATAGRGAAGTRVGGRSPRTPVPARTGPGAD